MTKPSEGPPGDYRRTMEMSISREEFLRLLPAAVGRFEIASRAPGLRFAPAAVPPSGASTAHRAPGAPAWSIDLVPLTPLRLGSSVMPRHRVDLVLLDCSDDERRAFVERFERAFLRGGG
jgi:hypothetical protein